MEGKIANIKWKWVGQTVRQESERCIKTIMQRKPKIHKRNIGRPPKQKQSNQINTIFTTDTQSMMYVHRATWDCNIFL